MRKFKFLILGGVLVLAVFIFVGAGCLVPEEPKNETTGLLLRLKKQTGIPFEEILDIEFNWNIETEKGVQGAKILGKRMEGIGILPEKIKKIKEFFDNESFVKDIHNIAAGAAVSLGGFKKENMICVVRSGIVAGKDNVDIEILREDVIISCGEIEKRVDANVGLANPASIYCKNKGGKLIHITDISGVSGYCILPDERVCQQWKFFYSEGEECYELGIGFTSEEGCKKACMEAGLPTEAPAKEGRPSGGCKLVNEIEVGETNLGACLIRESSTFCGQPNKCYCRCEERGLDL